MAPLFRMAGFQITGAIRDSPIFFSFPERFFFFFFSLSLKEKATNERADDMAPVIWKGPIPKGGIA